METLLKIKAKDLYIYINIDPSPNIINNNYQLNLYTHVYINNNKKQITYLLLRVDIHSIVQIMSYLIFLSV